MTRSPVWLAVALLGIASCAAFTSVCAPRPIRGDLPALEVLEMDGDLLVVSKPWDVNCGSFRIKPVVEKPGGVRVDGEQVTVMQMAMNLFPDEETPNLRFCHRLDFATSGVLCMARSKEAATAVYRIFEERTATKRYIAVCYGHILQDHLRIETPIADYPHGPDEIEADFRMCLGTVDNPGRAALTEVEVVARGVYRGSNVTKVSLAPSTGRRHQLRVHLASIGHSIVGDSTYCGTAAASLTGAPRMMLHALSLALPLPDRYGGPREWVAPDPFLDVLEPALGESG